MADLIDTALLKVGDVAELVGGGYKDERGVFLILGRHHDIHGDWIVLRPARIDGKPDRRSKPRAHIYPGRRWRVIRR